MAVTLSGIQLTVRCSEIVEMYSHELQTFRWAHHALLNLFNDNTSAEEAMQIRQAQRLIRTIEASRNDVEVGE